jgi:hypothetical protein
VGVGGGEAEEGEREEARVLQVKGACLALHIINIDIFACGYSCFVFGYISELTWRAAGLAA